MRSDALCVQCRKAKRYGNRNVIDCRMFADRATLKRYPINRARSYLIRHGLMEVA